MKIYAENIRNILIVLFFAIALRFVLERASFFIHELSVLL